MPCYAMQVNDTWLVASRMNQVPRSYIAAAILPAAIITGRPF